MFDDMFSHIDSVEYMSMTDRRMNRTVTAHKYSDAW